jgi:hypothetical protein
MLLIMIFIGAACEPAHNNFCDYLPKKTLDTPDLDNFTIRQDKFLPIRMLLYVLYKFVNYYYYLLLLLLLSSTLSSSSSSSKKAVIQHSYLIYIFEVPGMDPDYRLSMLTEVSVDIFRAVWKSQNVP